MIYTSRLKPAGWLQEQVEPYRSCSFPGFLRERVGDPEKPALIYGDDVLTYAALHDAIDATAQALIGAYAVSPGDRVVLNMDNSAAMIVCYLAIHRTGAVAVPVNPKLVAKELDFLVSDASPALYVCDEARLGMAEPICAERGVGLVGAGSLVSYRPEPDVALPEVDSDSPASIFYTSGTTGHPKGVIHTHATLVSGAFQSSAGWGYDFAHTAVAVTPLFHVSSHGWFYPLLAFEGTLVVDTYGTERSLQLIQQHGAEAFNAVPAMLLMMASAEYRTKYDTSSVTHVRFGASPMPPEKLAAVQALFPNARFWHGMGQTESGGTISVLPPELAFEKNGSTGFPIPGCEVRIVDDEDNDLPANTPGEVLARGPQVMVGYLDQPDATAKTLAGGWLHTGDVGYVDADGCVYLVDRKKDMIIRGGENISSVEIENHIVSHPDILACAVIGLADPVLGERVCAAYVPRDGWDGQEDELIAALDRFCRDEFAAFKVPEVWKRFDTLPATATGKLQKAELRRSLASPPRLAS